MLSIYQGKGRVYIDGGVSFEFSDYNNLKILLQKEKEWVFFPNKYGNSSIKFCNCSMHNSIAQDKRVEEECLCLQNHW